MSGCKGDSGKVDGGRRMKDGSSCGVEHKTV